MVYLAIMFLVGAVGIGSLIVQQRRERAHMDSVEGFRQSLQKISPESRPGPFRTARPRPRPNGRRSVGRPVPMNAAQREAARRRVEARRRQRAHARPRPAAARRVS